MSETTKKVNHAALTLSAIVSGSITAWEASYAFYWLFGAWLPVWPALAVIIAWSAVLSFSTALLRELGKPVIWTAYVFGQTIGLIWFMLWMATYSPLHFPLLAK